MHDCVELSADAISSCVMPSSRRSCRSDFQFMTAILPDLRFVSKRISSKPETYPAEMKKERSAFGERLLKARKHAELTQTELASALGMPQTTYAEAELTGKGSTYTAQIAKRCGVDAVWIATGEGEMISKEIVWPFVLITPEQVATIHPDRLITVQEVALSYVGTRMSQVVTETSLVQDDRSSNRAGSIRRLTTRKSQTDAKRIQAPSKSRKPGGGGHAS
jgi:DNA-binding XRE family transcriptional regulator